MHPGSSPPSIDELSELMAIDAEQTLLTEIRDALRGSAINVAISNHVTDPETIANFPVPGMQRLVLPKIATGGKLVVSSNAVASVLPHNPSRYGGTIVNVGEFEVTLILAGTDTAGAQNAGLGQIGLVAGGGSWDLRLGNLLWCGSISAQVAPGEAKANETTLTVVEV